MMDFGIVGLIQKGPPNLVTITNTGDATLNITGKAIVSSSEFVFDTSASSNCGTTLAPGQSCTIGVIYFPHNFGAVTGMLRITTNAPNSPHLVQLEGNCPL